MNGCKKFLGGTQKKKMKENILMTFVFKCNKKTGFFSFDESDDKPIFKYYSNRL